MEEGIRSSVPPNLMCITVLRIFFTTGAQLENMFIAISVALKELSKIIISGTNGENMFSGSTDGPIFSKIHVGVVTEKMEPLVAPSFRFL